MRIVELIRLEESSQGTFGVLRIDKQIECYTLEPPDNNNASNISSIPARQYICSRYKSVKFGETFIVNDVQGRWGVLFHAGNTVADTLGCIMLGETIGKLKGDRAILNSGNTFKRFLDIMSGEDKFHLSISSIL